MGPQSGRAPAAADGLAFVDAHAVPIAAPVEVVWRRLERHVGKVLCRAEYGVLDRLLGTAAPGGFTVAESEPPRRLALAGRHRLARYVLEFELTGVDAGTQLTARTFAEFPGWRGRAYRLAVIRSGLHVFATRRILRAIATPA
jgi:hypothetical protein